MDLHGARVRDVLPRLGGSELGVPDASEIFPMETRALAIAFFFAIGTAVGGITGPLLFGQMIESGDPGQVTIAFLIGSAVMALGGIVAAFLAVRAEQTPGGDARPRDRPDREGRRCERADGAPEPGAARRGAALGAGTLPGCSRGGSGGGPRPQSGALHLRAREPRRVGAPGAVQFDARG